MSVHDSCNFLLFLKTETLPQFSFPLLNNSLEMLHRLYCQIHSGDEKNGLLYLCQYLPPSAGSSYIRLHTGYSLLGSILVFYWPWIFAIGFLYILSFYKGILSRARFMKFYFCPKLQNDNWKNSCHCHHHHHHINNSPLSHGFPNIFPLHFLIGSHIISVR